LVNRLTKLTCIDSNAIITMLAKNNDNSSILLVMSFLF
jgi:hypothetical protein